MLKSRSVRMEEIDISVVTVDSVPAFISGGDGFDGLFAHFCFWA